MSNEEHLIQVIAYRKGHDKTSGKSYTYQKHFKDLKITSIVNLFKNLDAVVAAIPKGERYDCHYTNANCHEPTDDKAVPLRLFHHQEMIPVDLDHIDMSRQKEYIDIVEKILRLDMSKTGLFNSGHGLHFVIALTQPIETGEELHRLQKYYLALATKVTLEFFNNGLIGEMDSVRLAESSTLRLPLTENRKFPEYPIQSSVIQGNVEPQPFYLDRLVDVKEDAEIAHSTRAVDTKAVLAGCNFLKYCLANPASVTEPQWYGSIGINAFIPEIGITLCHTYSEKHPDYSFEETQAKAEQALGFGKARTCESIAQVFPGCNQCPYYNKIKTPLSIKSEEFISTETTGFHNVIYDQNGVPKKPIPNYSDLMKYFNKSHTFVVNEKSRQLSIFNGTHWEAITDARIENFATVNFKPIANNTMRAEFKGLLLTSNVVDEKFFVKDNTGYVNFKNGVLRLEDRKLLPHSCDFGFNYVLPYDHNPNAVCPEFDKMMDNVTLKDKDMQSLLLEYVGYAISGMRASFGAKALILTGGGSNGKSTFLNVIKMLVGDACFSTVTLEEMNNSNSRFSMVGKLFNICEEVEETELRKGTATFKSIVTGANLMVKKLYSDTVSMRIDTKLILSCNDLPSSRENTYAIYRRMLIVPFKAKFDKTTGIDKRIEDRIQKEMSGVYNRVLDSLDRFIKNEGAFTESTIAEKALADYKYSNSLYNQFVDACLIRGGIEDVISSTRLMEVYNEWARLNNVIHKASSQKVLKELRTIGIIIGDSEIIPMGKSSQRVYRYIKEQGVQNF